MVFSFGKENLEGQLGHGDTSSRSNPTVINKLKNLGEKVNFISCGFKHTICKTNLGKIFTWGAGDFGQLGNGALTNEYIPKLIDIDKLNSIKHTHKVLQIKAGFRSSHVLLSNHKIFWWGTNSTLNKCSIPKILNYSPLLNVNYRS